MLKNIKKLHLTNLLDYKISDLSEIAILYQNNKYDSAEKKYLEYLTIYNNDPDILHNLACALFMQEKYNLALEYFIKSSNIVWSYHSTYHFISSALYYNRGLATNNKNDFIKAEFLYHENIDAKNAINNNINKTEQNVMHGLKVQNTLGDLCIFNNKNITIEIIDASHFKYHCEAAKHFFNRGICFSKLQKYDVALSDFIRASEFDNKNPNNDTINDFIVDTRKYL